VRWLCRGVARSTWAANRQLTSVLAYLLAVCTLPQAFSYWEGINLVLLPPAPFIAGSVIFGVVYGAKRNGELVAHLEGKAFGLRVPNVMRM
jgi:hypothetical protein